MRLVFVGWYQGNNIVHVYGAFQWKGQGLTKAVSGIAEFTGKESYESIYSVLSIRKSNEGFIVGRLLDEQRSGIATTDVLTSEFIPIY